MARHLCLTTLRPRHPCRIVPRGEADVGEACSSALHCPCSAGSSARTSMCGRSRLQWHRSPRRTPERMLTMRAGLITRKCHSLFPARPLSYA
jgi:hypothetical protein